MEKETETREGSEWTQVLIGLAIGVVVITILFLRVNSNTMLSVSSNTREEVTSTFESYEHLELINIVEFKDESLLVSWRWINYGLTNLNVPREEEKGLQEKIDLVDLKR